MARTTDQQLQGAAQDMLYTVRFCDHIISGGQTGADRAALDLAI
jgi:Circularly permutated YpsA SLOG family